MEMRPLFILKDKVIKGVGRGHKLGFPTANLDFPKSDKFCEVGVYAVRVKIANKSYLGVANAGIPLTFYEDRARIDVHIFGFDGNLYEKEITIEFWKKIRNIKRFTNEQELIWQIEDDIIEAQKIFQTLNLSSEFFSFRKIFRNFATTVFNF